MMSSRDDFLRVPKVAPDGSNWISVKDRFRWAANAHGQLDHIEGGASEPMPPVPSARTPGNSGADAPELQAEADKAAEDDVKAHIRKMGISFCFLLLLFPFFCPLFLPLH